MKDSGDGEKDKDRDRYGEIMREVGDLDGKNSNQEGSVDRSEERRVGKEC